MKEGQLKAYINEFEELAEQLGLTQANPMTTQAFMAGLTTSLQDQVNSQPIYGYRVARARAIQEDQAQHAVAEALRARQRQRQRLIDRIQRRHEPVQDEEPSTKSPTTLAQRPSALDHSDQPRNLTAVIPDKTPVENQHPITEAIRTKRGRPTSTEYSSQPEDGSTIINPDESVIKKQRMMDHPLVEEQVTEEQEKHNTVPREESQAMSAVKRPIAADYFDHQGSESTTTNSDEPLSKKQRIAFMEIHSPSNIDHIRSSNMDVYISARKSMTVRTYIHSKSVTIRNHTL
jgi:hypothetical protein